MVPNSSAWSAATLGMLTSAYRPRRYSLELLQSLQSLKNRAKLDWIEWSILQLPEREYHELPRTTWQRL